MFAKYLPLLFLAESAFGKTLSSPACCYQDLMPEAPNCDGPSIPKPNVDICDCPLSIFLPYTSCNPARTDRIVLYDSDSAVAQAVTYLFICGGPEPCTDAEEPAQRAVIEIDRNTFTPEELEEWPFTDGSSLRSLTPQYESYDEDDRTFIPESRGDPFLWSSQIAAQYERYVYLNLEECEKYENIWGPQLIHTCRDDFESGEFGRGCKCREARDWWDNGFFECPDRTKKAAVPCPSGRCGAICNACLRYIGCEEEEAS